MVGVWRPRWLRRLDSNQQCGSQSPVSYHLTTSQYGTPSGNRTRTSTLKVWPPIPVSQMGAWR